MQKLKDNPLGKSTIAGVGSMQSKPKKDPYTMDFDDLRKDYDEDAMVKVPFANSSFVHYSKCPRNMNIDGKEYTDLVLTMELVQVPSKLKYFELEDPLAQKTAPLSSDEQTEVKSASSFKSASGGSARSQPQKEMETSAIVATELQEQSFYSTQNVQSNLRLDDDAVSRDTSPQRKIYRAMTRKMTEMKKQREAGNTAVKLNQPLSLKDLELSSDEKEDVPLPMPSPKQTPIRQQSPQRSSSCEASSVAYSQFGPKKESVVTQPQPKKQERRYSSFQGFKPSTLNQLRSGHQKQRISEQSDSVGSDGSLYTEEEEEDSKNSSDTTEQDRNYVGDMFGRNHAKFKARKSKVEGCMNSELETIESVNISIWTSCGTLVRFKRLRNQIIPVPCFKQDQRFRISHDAQRLYYLGKEHLGKDRRGQDKYKKKLVVVYLKDLSYQFYDLGKDAESVMTFEHSSLVHDYLCYMTERSEQSRTRRNFKVLNYKEQKVEWKLPDCVNVFFLGVDASLLPTLDFRDGRQSMLREEDESDLDYQEGMAIHGQADNFMQKQLTMHLTGLEKENDSPLKGFMVIKKEQQDKVPDSDESNSTDKGDKVYIRTYYPKWGEEKFQDQSRVIFETSYTQLSGLKRAKRFLLKKKTDDQILAISGCMLRNLCLIIKGSKGEQQKVVMFEYPNKQHKISSNRQADVDVEFTMNSHIRLFEEIFIIQTDPGNKVTAKPLNFNPYNEIISKENLDQKLAPQTPEIAFTNAKEGFSKECWVVKQPGQEVEKARTIMTVQMSEGGNYINSDCIIPIHNDDEAEDENFVLKYKYRTQSISSQEVDVTFPCIVSNIGLLQIMVQSVARPDEIACIRLDKLSGAIDEVPEFLCFTDYDDPEDIGLTDQRGPQRAEQVPYSELKQRICFITRTNKRNSVKSQLNLNVLSIDPYSEPAKYSLRTTKFEAKMIDGMKDDYVKKCFTALLTSDRGLDVSFVAQYRERIIFDCVTSVKQRPIRFPMPKNQAERDTKYKDDPDFGEGQRYQDNELAKDVRMVKQKMIMDDKGAIYWMMYNINEEVLVMRATAHSEMSSPTFIKVVYELQSSCIYFLQFYQGEFYLMDDKKRIRIFKANKMDHEWSLVRTRELLPDDALQITYSDFDNFTISRGVLHYQDKMFFLFKKDTPTSTTWKAAFYGQKGHQFVSGPFTSKNSGLIWSIQSHINNTDDVEKEDVTTKLQRSLSLRQNNGIKESYFKGTSLIVQPLGDSSYMDILPIKGENNNNFMTFLSDKHVLANYAGRYIVLTTQGQFISQVQFRNSPESFDCRRLKLIHVSDSGKFFLFEGENFVKSKDLERVHKQRRFNPIKESKVEERRYYVFKLERVSDKELHKTYYFEPYTTKLQPETNEDVEATVTHQIDHKGNVQVCTTNSLSIQESNLNGERRVQVKIKSYRSKKQGEQPHEYDNNSWKNAINQGDPDANVEHYSLSFKAEGQRNKIQVLQQKIKEEEEKIIKGIGSEDLWKQLNLRLKQIERAWAFENYVVVKSGSRVRYVDRVRKGNAQRKNDNLDEGKLLRITPGPKVWVESISTTGIKDLVQILIIDDWNRRVYLITWNMKLNREHSLYQTTYAKGVFPEKLLVRGLSSNKHVDFNYLIDGCAIVSLQNNIPVQFFDFEDDSEVLPKGLISQVEGMRRLTGDRSKFLDLIKPGRVHHFTSLTDLLYWQRYADQKESHEIEEGELSSISPYVRFFDGMSVFHHYAAEVEVLQAVTNFIKTNKSSDEKDQRTQLTPLLFMYSNPMKNELGKNTTPIHLAIDKQSSVAFETMFRALSDYPKNFVTGQLLDQLDYIIEHPSKAVIDFFSNSFFITDQFEGLHGLVWNDEGSDEKVLEMSTSYLTHTTLQNGVTLNNGEDQDEKPKPADLVQMAEDEEVVFSSESTQEETRDQEKIRGGGPVEYSKNIETQHNKTDEYKIKQVEAMLLDFNWIFSGDNAAYVINILANTKNDAIFATAQIKVLIDFMWDRHYFRAILLWFTIPFMVNFLSFILYASAFAYYEKDNGMVDSYRTAELICLSVYFSSAVYLIGIEVMQLVYDGWKHYWTDPWNYLDLTSISINLYYNYRMIYRYEDWQSNNVLATFCVILMYLKLFYWMRLFKPFSAFVRMISEILADSKVFFIVLMFSLMALANVIYILNMNHHEHFDCTVDGGEVCDPIFESAFGIEPLDALVHAYLTGLGDFRTDSYAVGDGSVTWLFFLLGTVVVQLIFMNVLIAIMGDSFARINEIIGQSTLKELCVLMDDHVWLCDIAKLHASDRYILWLTPDTSQGEGKAIEKRLTMLNEDIKDLQEAQDQTITKVEFMAEDVTAMQDQTMIKVQKLTDQVTKLTALLGKNKSRAK